MSSIVIKSNAQDANYWSEAHNSSGILSPGSAVAFTRDSGVLYFNPALLAYNTRNSATISGSFYQINSLNIKNGAGDRLNLKSTNVNIIPVIASGIVSIQGKKRLTIGYAIINNPVINYKTNQLRDDKFDVLNNSYSPGPEIFIGQYAAQNSINETSGILSTGFKIARNLALGIGATATYRTQHLVNNYTARTFINNGKTADLASISSVQELYDVSHYNVSLKFKIGLAYDKLNHHFGLTVSSPLVKIKSNAELLSDNFISDLRINNDTISLLATSRQNKLKETWKAPLSVAIGYAYDLNWGQIYLSTEYFNSIKEYNIITPRNDAFIRDLPAIDNSLVSSLVQLKDARSSILNFGLGITYFIKQDIAGFISVRTDYSYANNKLYKNNNGYTSNTSRYDIYHLQLGTSIKKRKFNFRTGLLLDYGHSNRFVQPVNLSNPNEGNFLYGDTHVVPSTYFSIGVMFAYLHNF